MLAMLSVLAATLPYGSGMAGPGAPPYWLDPEPEPDPNVRLPARQRGKHPDRPLTLEDVRRIEAAQAKRARRAAKRKASPLAPSTEPSGSTTSP